MRVQGMCWRFKEEGRYEIHIGERRRMNGKALRTGTVRPTFISAAQSKQDVRGTASRPVLGPQSGRQWKGWVFPASV